MSVPITDFDWALPAVAAFRNHVQNTANPHAVTAQQVGADTPAQRDTAIAALAAQTSASLDLVSPPTLDFSRPAMSGTFPLFGRI